ncbi:MAG: amidohydrolase family protein, partial [Myxococcota bacterium]
NLQLACHAIGDEAVTLALDGARGCEDRLRIEHAQIVKPSDRSRFRGVVAAMQPHHRRDDAEILESRLGERAHWAFPFEALRHAGATVCFGSDAPVSNLSPLEGMAAAAEAGVSDPLRGYTLEAMRASRAGRSGAIEPGAPADFTVVNVAPGRSGGRVLERWRDGEALASESRILA